VAGTYYLREFVRNPDAACPVTMPGEKQRVMDRLKSAVSERTFDMTILGIMARACELACNFYPCQLRNSDAHPDRTLRAIRAVRGDQNMLEHGALHGAKITAQPHNAAAVRPNR
jgi:hypothetical protein